MMVMMMIVMAVNRSSCHFPKLSSSIYLVLTGNTTLLSNHLFPKGLILSASATPPRQISKARSVLFSLPAFRI